MIDPNQAIAALVAATSLPTPVPVPGFDGDPNVVTPGVIGFMLTLLVAVVTVLLVFDMTRRVRRVRYREQVNAELDAELAAEQRTTEPGDSSPR
jgi:hypothetical protein